jgi:hypothetical protein
MGWRKDLTPLTGARWPIRCGRVFDPSEVARLRQGALWPSDMNERWAIWLEGSVLRCWRTDSGACVYESLLSFSEDGSAHAAVLNVLDEPELYARAPSDERELDRFEGVLTQAKGRLDRL